MDRPFCRYLWPTRTLQVKRIDLSIGDGALARKREVLAHSLSGTVAITVEAVSIEQDALRAARDPL